VVKKLDGGALKKLGDRMLGRSQQVLLRAVVCDHGDENDLELTVGFVVVSLDCEETTVFSDLHSCCICSMCGTGAWIRRRLVWSSVV